MDTVSHQTIKLSRGAHGSPDEGACVMELASILAGEPFTDRPATACPVIGSLLRAYNDSVDDARRQDLYEYAARVVGSQASELVQRARAEHLAAWAAERLPGRRPWLARRRRWQVGAWLRKSELETLGAQAIRLISKHTDETHAAVLAVLDELLGIGARGQSTVDGFTNADADAGAPRSRPAAGGHESARPVGRCGSRPRVLDTARAARRGAE